MKSEFYTTTALTLDTCMLMLSDARLEDLVRDWIGGIRDREPPFLHLSVALAAALFQASIRGVRCCSCNFALK